MVYQTSIQTHKPKVKPLKLQFTDGISEKCANTYTQSEDFQAFPQKFSHGFRNVTSEIDYKRKFISWLSNT